VIAFQDYLEAKRPVDDRGRNADVYAAFRAALAERAAAAAMRGRPVRVLDAGTGTGAMVRRLLAEPVGTPLEIVAIDRDAKSLARARGLVLAAAAKAGLLCGDDGELITVGAGEHAATVRLVRTDMVEGALPFTFLFDIVMAHALMDILPVDLALGRIAGLLEPGGCFYATITYDGRTTLVPAAGDPAFEERVLAVYDRSMDDRRAHGLATGGSRAGTRLVAALPGAGLELTGCGASDWSVYPFGGTYLGRDAVFLEAILRMIAAEGLRQGLPTDATNAWLAARLADLAAARLGLIVHQLDVLARRNATTGGEGRGILSP
jgi:SAM-dependent methyltransferase